IWGLATMGHALTGTWSGLAFMRALMGFSEASAIPAQDTALTTIRGLDTMYVDLTRSSVDLLRLRKQSLATNSDTMSVSLILEDGTT
ncbi:hypothetical protein QR504_25660, partial [Escherichia coli]|nr:hypothetical protein [Escherichia coli]